MKGSGAARDEAGHGAGERHSPSLTVIATCLLMSVAASLAGCRGPGHYCTPAGDPIQTITYTPDAIREVYIHGNSAWETEIVTVANATNHVSIDIEESLAGFFEVEHDDDSGRLVLQMWQDGCPTTGAKVKITVPEPVQTLEVGCGSATADKVTRRVNYVPARIHTSLSGVRVHELEGDWVEIKFDPIEDYLAMTVDSVHANSLTIIAHGDVDVIGGYVSKHVEVIMDGRSQVSLGSVTTPSADIWAEEDWEGSFFGLTSQNCTINCLAAGRATFVTNVTEHVEAQCASAPRMMLITGPAVKSGSCFDGALGVQALV